MNNYEQRVREIAEEMANKMWPGLNFEGDLIRSRKNAIDHFIPAARIAVKHMAEEYINGYMSNFHGENYDENPEEDKLIWESNARWEAKERGLIPPTEAEKEVEK